MRFYRPLFLARVLYPGGIFRFDSDGKAACLTFDDGPDPVSTGIILEILRRYKIKAIFFCKGDAAEKYQSLVSDIRSEGHNIGNHGYNHLDGFKTSDGEYAANVAMADDLTSSFLFRPPYGRMKLSQYRLLSSKYRIVFWDVMPYDFDRSFSPGKSMKILMKKLRPGSIIVLHDNPSGTAPVYLEEFIKSALSMGYRFEIPESLKPISRAELF